MSIKCFFRAYRGEGGRRFFFEEVAGYELTRPETVCDAAAVTTTPLPSPSTALLTHDLRPRTVSAGLPEQTMLLDADLSPHQASFDDSGASDPKTEVPHFNTGIFMLVTLLRLRLRSVPPDFHTKSCFSLMGSATIGFVPLRKSREDWTRVNCVAFKEKFLRFSAKSDSQQLWEVEDWKSVLECVKVVVAERAECEEDLCVVGGGGADDALHALSRGIFVF